MRIDILCNDGSPIGIVYDDIYGRLDRVGVGGAELALLTLCEQLGSEGYQIRLYNNPRIVRANPYFEQFPVSSFVPSEDRDVLIIFRSPHPASLDAKGYKVWWSCDPHTMGDYRKFSQTVRKIVVISDFHKTKFNQMYGVDNAEVIDLPIRVMDYRPENPPQRIPGKVLFSSVPDRGLDFMLTIWPIIQAKVPDAELVITSDYRLWGVGPLNERFRLKFAGLRQVRFLGAVVRDQLVQEQLSSSVLAYPSIFEELFCIACAEAQVAGCFPFTSTCGALSTTNTHRLFPGDPHNPYWQAEFGEAVAESLLNPDESEREEMQKRAADKYDPARIAGIWKEKIFTV